MLALRRLPPPPLRTPLAAGVDEPMAVDSQPAVSAYPTAAGSAAGSPAGALPRRSGRTGGRQFVGFLFGLKDGPGHARPEPHPQQTPSASSSRRHGDLRVYPVRR